MSRRYLVACAAIVGIAAVLTLHRLGAADVCGVNEAVEGVFVQQMVEHDALLFPLENGRSPMYKPPLFHWTATAIDRLAGINKVTPFNLRLPAAIYAIAGVILTMAFARAYIGPAGAILAGVVLCGSYQYIEQGRIGRVDMTLCFFETLALFAFAWWWAPPPAELSAISEPHPQHRGALRYLFALALGLGVLAKGPVGAILPVTACAIFLIIERRSGYSGQRYADLRKIIAPAPALLAIVIGGSWYAACFFGRRYGFLDRQIGSENFGRFFGALGAMPPWYYLKPILLNSAPLSLFVPVSVYYALRTWWVPSSFSTPIPGPLNTPSSATRGEPVREAVRLFAIFWIVTVAFFSVAAYKRRAYLLPLWPVSAVMIAWWLDALARTYYTGRLVRGFVAVIGAGLIVFNFFYLPRRAVRECDSGSFKQAAAEINRIVGRDEPLYSYGLDGEPAPLLFYLDRNAPPIDGKLGDAPPGYVIVPARVWAKHQDEALDLQPVFESSSGRERLMLLRHGKVYVRR
jgi:4-amino-4-deoxy-L-arabinose transferase-like glycosyltransferase